MNDNGMVNAQNNLLSELRREQVLCGLQLTRKKAFDDYTDSHIVSPKPLSLNMPISALEYFCIPRELSNLVKSPEQIKLLPLQLRDEAAHFLVIESCEEAVSNQAVLEEFLQRTQNGKNMMEVVEEGNIIRHQPITVPDGIDLFHGEYPNLLASGVLGINDRVLLDIAFERRPNSQLYVARYSDRPENRGKGIATSFYKNLGALARQMNYRFISGENRIKKENNGPGNMGFFVDKLGRYPLSRIKSHYRSFFHPAPELVNQNEYTISFLYPEDIQEYVEA